MVHYGTFGVAAAILVVMLGAGCTGPSALVLLQGDRFSRDTAILEPGDSLRFKNVDPHDHAVVISFLRPQPPIVLVDRVLEPGRVMSFAFAEEGPYRVHCRIHGDDTDGMGFYVSVGGESVPTQ